MQIQKCFCNKLDYIIGGGGLFCEINLWLRTIRLWFGGEYDLYVNETLTCKLWCESYRMALAITSLY